MQQRVLTYSINMNGRMYDPSGENGNEPQGNSSGNHGSPGGGGGSVEVKPIGNGKYEVVNGLNDGGNTEYVVDNQGNRTGEILGYTLTPYTFYNQYGNIVTGATIDKNPFDPNNLIEFINWNPAPDVYTSYKCEEIGLTDIYDAMKQGNVVSFMCDFTDEMADMFGLTNKGHFVNLNYIKIGNGRVKIGFNDHPDNNYFIENYKSCTTTDVFWKDDFKRYFDNIGQYKPIIECPRIIKIQIIFKP